MQVFRPISLFLILGMIIPPALPVAIGVSFAEGPIQQASAGASDRPAEPAAAAEQAPDEELAAPPLPAGDVMHRLQHEAITAGKADWGHWGSDPEQYSAWKNHSNRLIPIYTFGITLEELRRRGSPYASEAMLQQLYGRVPEATLNREAEYFDQTDVFKLQQQAIRAGKRQVILVIFDGMDWDTTYAAALYRLGKVGYREGRGMGLSFQDYRGTKTDFGFFVTSPLLDKVQYDVNAQTVIDGDRPATGGYDPQRGGNAPWQRPPSRDYLMGRDREMPHTVTDSASSATSMTAGIKTYNAAINVDALGNQVETIAHQLQRERGLAIGVVTSVPISHATPAAAYSHNVTRQDYQDLTRDLIGLPSVSHRNDPLPGVDVLLGAGWGETKETDDAQGANFVPGLQFYDPADIDRVSLEQGGRYVVAQRTADRSGAEVLRQATEQAIEQNTRLLGIFGASGGNLPYATANGNYIPSVDAQKQQQYRQADIDENPTLTDMTLAALDVLATHPNGFWLMVEPGDVDWANHANNLDHSIGATLSGDAAVAAIFNWIEQRDAWDETAVIVTADHGHHFVLTDPQTIAAAGHPPEPEAATKPAPVQSEPEASATTTAPVQSEPEAPATESRSAARGP